jgi:hypothetical protein
VLVAAFGRDNGTTVLRETIQYLAKCSEDEQTCATALAEAVFQLTVVCGRRRKSVRADRRGCVPWDAVN